MHTCRSLLPEFLQNAKQKLQAQLLVKIKKNILLLFAMASCFAASWTKLLFGATDFSLVHAVYEAYGPAKAGLLLNSLGRLFTAYLQYYSGHSCRMEDLILTKESDGIRRNLIEVSGVFLVDFCFLNMILD